MITLNLSPNIEQVIHLQAEQAGLSVEHYLIQYISILASHHATTNGVAQFVHGKQLDSFPADVVAWQKAMRIV